MSNSNTQTARPTYEETLRAAIHTVMPAYHLALDGEPDEACVYRYTGDAVLYESNVPILRRESYQVYVYQTQYAVGRAESVFNALTQAGFSCAFGNQTMENMFYRDEIRASHVVYLTTQS